jgi:hypothetical protein
MLGLVELVVPDRLIEFWERLALENPEECSLRAWISPIARIEGLVILVAALRPGTLSGVFRSALGCYGLLAAISPQGYLDYWTPLIYEDHERCEWKPWVVPTTRAIGALYVLIALFGWKERRDDGR